MNDSPTALLSRAGVSIWLDDLSRERLDSGNLVELIETRDVVGVTTNPTIFAGAFANGQAYAEGVAEARAAGMSTEATIFELMSRDVSDACDVFQPIFERTHGYDGRVSIEVAPSLARDTEGTVAQAKELWARINRPNAMIKIPATEEGLPAITAAIAAGISVNVTLIFSLERYRAVTNAYLTGLEQARAAGIPLAGIHSVASFFVSRVDTEVDRRLNEVGTDEALALRSDAGIANARLAYEIFLESFASERARMLLAAGANSQRPLWASTGVKDPSLPDTRYVVELVAEGVVNTMPAGTLEATADHGVVRGDTISGTFSESNAHLNALDGVGIDYTEVTDLLEVEGLAKFDASWDELVEMVDTALKGAQ
ncbi:MULTISPECIES: transaldolase [unclassified Leucobacter]|uniref:transaldolase n=1 Tax=unclassified Leucobacter TaxID=2621730 RepID=UPI00165E53A6|nr:MULTISPECIES: transaldolase [unclassified Leucobacter]MBC9935366.1 transaldolase [Leucobacter sp. cx-87]